MDPDEQIRKSGVVFGPSRPEKRIRAHQFRREMTPTEALLWQHLRAGRLAGLHFRRQQVIDGYIADFYCHAASLIVETDGAVHEDRREYDAARDALIATRGFRIIRIANQRVEQNIVGVLETIYAAAQETGLSLPAFVPPTHE